jgi:hypothetical protein
MFVTRIASTAVLTLYLLSLTACSAGRPVRQHQGAPDRYHITRTELENSGLTSVYDAVQQLRPYWLNHPKDGAIAVYINEQLVGGIANLRSVEIHAAEEARYMSATEAQVRFGHRNGLRPAILISLRR